MSLNLTTVSWTLSFFFSFFFFKFGSPRSFFDRVQLAVPLATLEGNTKHIPSVITDRQGKKVAFYVTSYPEILPNDNRDAVKPPRKWAVRRIGEETQSPFENLWLVATWGFLNQETELYLLVPWPHLSLRCGNWRLYNFFWNIYLVRSNSKPPKMSYGQEGGERNALPPYRRISS